MRIAVPPVTGVSRQPGRRAAYRRYLTPGWVLPTPLFIAVRNATQPRPHSPTRVQTPSIPAGPTVSVACPVSLSRDRRPVLIQAPVTIRSPRRPSLLPLVQVRTQPRIVSANVSPGADGYITHRLAVGGFASPVAVQAVASAMLPLLHNPRGPIPSDQ